MGRPRTAKHPRVEELPEEEISQEPPDEEGEPAQAPRRGRPPAGDGPSKAAIVREAMDSGLSDLDDIVDFARRTHGVEIKKGQVSTYKSQQKARDAKQTPKPKAARPSAAPGVIPPELFGDLKKLKEMRERYGDDGLRQLIDLV